MRIDSPELFGFWVVAAGILGLVVGSFLNVCIWRMPRDMSVVQPPSHCPGCNTRLRAIDLVPVLSFLVQGRKCRYCKEPISWRYAIVESITGAAFAGLVYVNGGMGADWAFDACLVAALIAIFAIDLEHTIIPDELNWVVLGTGIGRDVWGLATGTGRYAAALPVPGTDYVVNVPASVLGALVGLLLFAGIRYFGTLAFKREALGLGDVKLAPGIGAHLAWLGAVTSFFVAVVLGAVLGIAMAGVGWLRSGEHKSFRYIPFGPFMVLGAATIVYAGQWAVSLFLRFYSMVPPGGGLVQIRSWPLP